VGEVTLFADYSGDATFAAAEATTVEHIVNPATPTEMCGLDPRTTPNDPTGFVPITQLSGAVYTPGIAQDITGDGNLSVVISYPAANALIADMTVDVVGTFVGPTNTGITVNGIVASTVNGQFLVSGVPLTTGSNTLTITATTLPGAQATTSRVVNQGGSVSPLSLTVDSSTGASGFLPKTVTFDVAVAGAIQSIAIDTDGDGTYDYTAASLESLPTSFIYSRSGAYPVTLKAVDNSGNTYHVTRWVLIQDHAATRNMLCDIYGYLKDRLMAQDAAAASHTYQPYMQGQYQSLFIALGANMPSAAVALGTVANGFIGHGYAEMTLIRDNSNLSRNGFPLRMTQGIDGVWRISEM
jgi:hypothetical protein